MTEWEDRKIALNELPRKADDIDLLCDAGKDGWDREAVSGIAGRGEGSCL